MLNIKQVELKFTLGILDAGAVRTLNLSPAGQAGWSGVPAKKGIFCSIISVNSGRSGAGLLNICLARPHKPSRVLS